MAKKNQPKIKIRKSLVYKLNIIIFCLIVLEAGALVIRHAMLNKDFMNTIALATTVKPETFTELYFENHTQLPTTVTAYQKVSFSFTTHNLEYKIMRYPYEVYLDQDGKKTVIDKGFFYLDQDNYRTINETATIPYGLTKGKIVVDLTSKNQQVFFWVKGADEKVQ